MAELLTQHSKPAPHIFANSGSEEMASIVGAKPKMSKLWTDVTVNGSQDDQRLHVPQTGQSPGNGSDQGDPESPESSAPRARSVWSKEPHSAKSSLGGSISARHPSTASTQRSRALNYEIQHLMEDCTWASNSGRFLPEDKIDMAINHESVQRELDIGEDNEQTLSNIFPHRRKLLAILSMMGKSQAIFKLIDECIMDEHLPFQQERTPARSLSYHPLDQDRCPAVETRAIKSFEDWESWEQDSFFRYQWQLVVPHFVLGCDISPEFEHLRLQHTSTILPFVGGPGKKDDEYGDDVNSIRQVSDCDDSDAELQLNLEFHGGFSIVRKVGIHSAHRRCGHGKVSSPQGGCEKAFYAVKVIQKKYDSTSEAAVNNEVNNLKRFFDTDHGERLIRLLFTFEFGNQFHMIFPWADANLGQFWKHKFPDADIPKRGRELAGWVSREMLGIAEGLHMIHETSDKSPSDKDFGRHGDIKPENILWFFDGTHHGNPDHPTGVLKISDFGLTDFHSNLSKSLVRASKTGRSDTYRAPECEFGKFISPSYDLWSLGCVLLQFITWYVEGWHGVDKFSERRRMEDSPKHLLGGNFLSEDTFFNFRGAVSENPVVVNKAVTEQIEMLVQHERCSDLFVDVLDFIANRLLIVDPKPRATSAEAREKFAKIKKKFESDPAYSTTKSQSSMSGVNSKKENLSIAAGRTNQADTITSVANQDGLADLGPTESDRLARSSPIKTKRGISISKWAKSLCRVFARFFGSVRRR
ncbi:serine/threonine protein kinase [Ilyonectria robusta]